MISRKYKTKSVDPGQLLSTRRQPNIIRKLLYVVAFYSFYSLTYYYTLERLHALHLMSLHLSCLCLSLSFLLIFASNAYAVTRDVPCCSFQSLADVIAQCDDGDEVMMTTGTYTGSSSGPIVLNKRITIDGDFSVIDCKATGDVFVLGDRGDGIVVMRLTLSNYTIGIKHNGSDASITIDNVKFESSSRHAIHMIASRAAVTIINSSLFGGANTAIFVQGMNSRLTISDCLISHNKSPSNGGGVWVTGGGTVVMMTRTNITNNDAIIAVLAYGGGVAVGSGVVFDCSKYVHAYHVM